LSLPCSVCFVLHFCADAYQGVFLFRFPYGTSGSAALIKASL
jgi:hypothetical protein